MRPANDKMLRQRSELEHVAEPFEVLVHVVNDELVELVGRVKLILGYYVVQVVQSVVVGVHHLECLHAVHQNSVDLLSDVGPFDQILMDIYELI